MGFVFAFVLVTVALSIAIATTDYADTDDFPLWLTTLVNLPLQIGLIIAVVVATTTKGQGLRRDLSLSMKWTDIPKGFVMGLVLQVVLGLAVTAPLFWLFDRDVDEAGNVARELTDKASSPVAVVSLVLTVAIMAPISEELFYRGLLVGAFRKRRNAPWMERILPAAVRPDTTSHRWNVWFAALMNGLLFAVVHPDPWLWPALGILGVILAIMVERSGRLGTAIWTHVGFNTVTVLNLLLIDT